MKKIMSFCTWVSTALLIVFVGLYIYAWAFNPDLYLLSHPFFHIPLGKASMAVEKHDGGQVVFFNGSIPNNTTSTGPRNNTVSEKDWEGYGIYFRIIKDVSQPDIWWTLMISLWYPIIVFGTLPALFAIRKLCVEKKPKQY